MKDQLPEPPHQIAIDAALIEGEDAAKSGKHFKDDCPYTYNNFPGMTYREFNITKRPLMNAWFDAWKQAREDLAKEPK